MLAYLKGRLDALRAREQEPEQKNVPLTGQLLEDLISLRSQYHNSSDFLCREVELGGETRRTVADSAPAHSMSIAEKVAILAEQREALKELEGTEGRDGSCPDSIRPV